MDTAIPRMMPTGTNTLMSSHRSSSHPAPPQTAIPESIVPMIAQPVSAPLPPRAGLSGRGRESPRAGSFSAIAWGQYQPRVGGFSGSGREASAEGVGGVAAGGAGGGT